MIPGYGIPGTKVFNKMFTNEEPERFEADCKQAIDSAISYMAKPMGVLSRLAGSAKSYVTDQFKKFQHSQAQLPVVGQALATKSKKVIARSAGSMIGHSFPQALIAFSIGKGVANYIVKEEEKKENLPRKTLLIWSAGLGSVLALTALTTLATSYYNEEESNQSTFISSSALSYALSTLGATLGGMQGLWLIGEQPSGGNSLVDSYPIRTAQSLIMRDSVSWMRTLLPTPTSFPLWIASTALGNAAETAASFGGYYAQPIMQAYLHPAAPLPFTAYDPTVLIKNMIQKSHGTAAQFIEVLLDRNNNPLVQPILRSLLEKGLNEDKLLNGVARLLNQYGRVLKQSEVLEAIYAFRDASAEDKVSKQKMLIQTIHRFINSDSKFSDRILVNTLEIVGSKPVSKFSKFVTDQIEVQEKKYLGFNLVEQPTLQLLMEAHLTCFGSLLFLEMKNNREFFLNSSTTGALNDTEIEDFYKTLNQLILTPYNDFFIPLAIQVGLDSNMSLLMQNGEFIQTTVIEEGARLLKDKLSPSTSTPQEGNTLKSRWKFLSFFSIGEWWKSAKSFLQTFSTFLLRR